MPPVINVPSIEEPFTGNDVQGDVEHSSPENPILDTSDNSLEEPNSPDFLVDNTPFTGSIPITEEDSFPFVENPVSPEQSQPTVQEMIQTLTSLSALAKPYLDVGEDDNDAYLVKNAGYIWYLAGHLINQLES